MCAGHSLRSPVAHAGPPIVPTGARSSPAGEMSSDPAGIGESGQGGIRTPPDPLMGTPNRGARGQVDRRANGSGGPFEPQRFRIGTDNTPSGTDDNSRSRRGRDNNSPGGINVPVPNSPEVAEEATDDSIPRYITTPPDQAASSSGLRRLAVVNSTTTVAAAPELLDEEAATTALAEHAWDDMSGAPLDPALVRQARAKEMEYIKGKGVWSVIPRAQAQANKWKIIPTRWLDINKGDGANPNYRSRFVAKEFNTGSQEGLFAATPPLEALRLVLSLAATTDDRVGEKGGHGKRRRPGFLRSPHRAHRVRGADC